MTVHIQPQNRKDSKFIQDELIYLIASHLEVLVKKGDIYDTVFASSFEAEVVPQITILQYLQRLVKWNFCETNSLVLAFIYIDRLKNSELILTNLCIHRVLLSSLLVAIKFQEENHYKNRYYARVGGLSVEELNKMESEFLQLIDYQLYVDESEFNDHRHLLSLVERDVTLK